MKTPAPLSRYLLAAAVEQVIEELDEQARPPLDTTLRGRWVPLEAIGPQIHALGLPWEKRDQTALTSRLRWAETLIVMRGVEVQLEGVAAFLHGDYLAEHGESLGVT